MARALPRHTAFVATVLLVLVSTGVIAGVQLYGVKRLMSKLTGRTVTVDSVITELTPRVEPRWAALCAQSGLATPPNRIALLAFKAERFLEVWGGDSDGAMRFVCRYPILAASGGPGPKLREGDRQVPEGVYRIAVLNPMSRFHLSMGLDYPNAFDRARGAEDGRDNLGSDIYIHGGRASIGCLALGDPAIEELFWLVAQSGKENVDVIIAPNDARHGDFVVPADAPPWLGDVHDRIRAGWAEFPSP